MSLRFLTISLLGILLAGPSLAGPPDDASIDPALRLLLQRPDRDLQTVLSAAQAGSGAARPPVPLGVLDAASLSDTDRLEVFLEATEPPSGEGVESKALGGDIYTARVTLAGLRRLVAEGSLRAARLSRPVYPNLDESTRYLGLRQIRRVDPETGTFSGITGEGVVVGIVDTGVDWTHPDFYGRDGSTRIFRYWDQGVAFGSPPADFGFGQEYRSRAIDDGVAASLDPDGHGSHVLGIAAGTGRGSFVPGVGVAYAGIAPEATLVVVRTVFTEYGVASGAQYVFDRADLLGYPAVLNISLGNQFGPHRGNTLFEQALANLVAPGKLIVAAGGNDARAAIHAEMDLQEGEIETLEFQFPRYEKDPYRFIYMNIEGWSHRDNRYRFTVISPLGNVFGDVDYGDMDVEYHGTKGYSRAWYTEDQGMGNLMLEIEDDFATTRLAQGVWRLQVEALDVKDPDLDFWVVGFTGNVPGEYPFFVSHVDPEETIVVPGTSPGILAVGAFSTRACWSDAYGEDRCYTDPPAYGEIARFSSIGPTSDGRKKPEILAPGFGVMSVRSSNIAASVRPPSELDELGPPGGLYWLTQGTSMATPHVAGTVALLLEQYPTMTFDAMVGRLTARARGVVDPRTDREVFYLQTGDAVAPLVDLTLSELFTEPEGIRIEWSVGKERAPTTYRVLKAFDPDGPFHPLPAPRAIGRQQFEAFDGNPEPGRTHYYRIVAVDEFGLEDDLDRLSATVPGTPGFAFRAPDPNPAAGPVNLRFYFPPGSSGGEYRINVMDVAGRRVAEIESGRIAADGEEHVTHWDLKDSAGRRVAGGVYLVRVAYGAGAARTSLVRRVVVLP